MKKEIYYRYLYGKLSIFTALEKWENKQTKKRYGTKDWLKEQKKLTDEINKSIAWLPESKIEKEEKFYFKKPGMEKYEETLFKIHKRILSSERINKKKFYCFRKISNTKEYLYNFNTKRKIGEIIYEDKYQIGVI